MLRPAFAKAFRQLVEPAFRGVLLKAVGLSAIVYLALAGLILWLLSERIADWLQAHAWLAGLAQTLAGLFAVLLLLLLFPALITAFLGLFLEAIAAAVERRHYPADPPGREAPAAAALAQGLRFLVVVLAINLLALPLYLVGIWLPMVNFVVFYGVNGYLLGREYFVQVSMRHLPPPRATALRVRHRWTVFWAGVAIAVLLSVPLLNLVMPVVATAAMVHVFKGLQAARRA